MRPGPRRFWASSEAVARRCRRCSRSAPARSRRGSRRGRRARRSCGRARPSSARRGGCSRRACPSGTMIIEKRRYGSTSGFVLHMTIRKSVIDAFDENHLWPLMTHSSPSRTALRGEQRRVGAGAGLGHREAADRILPSSSGCIHCSLLLCRVVPPTAISSALPESGALLPKIAGRIRTGAEDLVHQAELHLAEARRRPSRAGGGRPTGPGASPPPSAAR